MKKNEAISILATSLRPREPKDRVRYDEAVKMAIDALNKPERKTGRWIPDNTDYYRTKFICSACGKSEEVPTTGFGYGTMWDYCPMCGAKMERGETE